MSFRDCITGQIELGRVGEDRGQRAIAEYEKRLARATEEGLDPVTAELSAAKAATEQLSNGNAVRRWQKMKEIVAADGIQKRLIKAKDPVRELERLMADVENDYSFVQSVAFSYIHNLMEKYKPKAVVGSTVEGLNQLVFAAYGRGGGPDDIANARALHEMYETLRVWANQHGANIPKSKNNVLPQTHEAARVERAREYTLQDGTRTNTWVEDHLRPGVVDWEIMRVNGAAIPVEGRRQAMLNMYDGIVADGKMRDKYILEGGGSTNLATRLGRDRFLHYAGPEAWLEMQGKYGAGNVYQQTIGMVDYLAKEISMLKTFGPSPGSMREFAARLSENQAAKKAREAGKSVQKASKRSARGVQVFRDMFDIHDRRTISVDGNWPVQTFSAIRTVAVTSRLGSSLIPSFFGDLANIKSMNKVYGLPQMEVTRNYFKEVAAGRIGREDAVSLGIVYEDAIGLALSRQRYFGTMDGPYWARVFGDQVYRIGLTSQHTQLARNATGKQFLNFLHKTKGVKFDDHPLAAVMTELGITQKDWDIMRAFGSRNVRGGMFLAPIDLFKVGNSDEKLIAEKFGNLLQNYIRSAVPDTTLRSRRAAGEAIDPNSALGQINRTMLSLLSFPVSLHFNQLRRIAELPNVRDKLVYGAGYVGFLTVAGAFVTQGKALATGQQLYDMSLFDEQGKFNLDFYGRAMVNGGSMGILGDLVMNSININNSSYRPGDPTTELLKAAHKLTVDNLIDAANGDPIDAGADAFNLGEKLVPKFWHTRVLLERAILDDLEKQVDPEGYRRALKYEREHQEGMWWETGGSPEALRPETAIGG
jgi:hypothetical protein